MFMKMCVKEGAVYLSDLGLDAGTENVFRRALLLAGSPRPIQIAELTEMDYRDMCRIRGLGRKRMLETVNKVHDAGFVFGDRLLDELDERWRVLEKFELDNIPSIVISDGVRRHLYEYLQKLWAANRGLMGARIALYLTAADNVFVSLQGIGYSFGFRSAVYKKGIDEDKLKVTDCSVGELLEKLGFAKQYIL